MVWVKSWTDQQWRKGRITGRVKHKTTGRENLVVEYLDGKSQGTVRLDLFDAHNRLLRIETGAYFSQSCCCFGSGPRKNVFKLDENQDEVAEEYKDVFRRRKDYGKQGIAYSS